MRHIWILKDELQGEEKQRVIREMKEALEGLNGQIPGLMDLKLHTQGLDSSNANVLLDSTFENEEALKNYSVNPIHVKVADENVRPFTKTRVCMDYNYPC